MDGIPEVVGRVGGAPEDAPRRAGVDLVDSRLGAAVQFLAVLFLEAERVDHRPLAGRRA